MTVATQLAKYIRFWGGALHCNICNRPLRKFFPFSTDLQQAARTHGFPYDFRRMETLNVDQCNCPFCLSNDRERLYLIFLLAYLQKNPGKFRLLDFAPSPKFSKRLRSLPQIDYTSADLLRDDVDVQVDICDLSLFGDNSFDIIICSHVLEHVSDADKAMRELARVLKPDGWAIIMVPLFWDVSETIEDSAYNNAALRTRHYGQYDHVRLFSHDDFIARLSAAGFNVRQVTPGSLDPEQIRKNAIAANSILYVCTLNAGS